MKSNYAVSGILALLCTLFSFNLGAASSSLVLANSHPEINLHKHMQWHIADKNTQLSDIQNVTNWQGSYSPHSIPANQSLWGKLTVDFNTPKEQHYFLTVANPKLDYVSVFLLDNKERILGAYLMGANRDYDKRPIRNRHFVAPINTNQQSVTIYLRINHHGPIMFGLYLTPESEHVENEQLMLATIGIICGGLGLLACYFFITYIFMRSPVRFWFALSTATFLLLFLNANGILGQITGLTAYISNLNCALFGLLLLTSAKVTFAILEKIPTLWRYTFYATGFLTLAMAFSQDTGLQLMFNLGLTGFNILLIAVLAYFYHKPDKKVANLVCLLGLALIALSGFAQVILYLAGFSMAQSTEMLFIMLITLGILFIALAIEAHERVLTSRHNIQQQLTITNLQHFYELFRNSTEGLYTSDLEGNLISVNPAMCQLFGYANETEMINEVNNTQQFYADTQDRDILLGEIRKNGKVLGKEVKGKRKDGSELWFSVSAQINSQQDSQYLCGSISDITERKQSNISLEYLATHDSLTGVFNRREFEQRLNIALLNAQDQYTDLALLYMDLDQFKTVNDTCGHKAGDLLLKQLANKLDNTVNEKGTLARLGGDEFAVLLVGENAQEAYLLANKLLNTVQAFRFVWENRIFTLGISIGHVPWQENIHTPEQILSMADSACYLAKERGRNQIHTYSSQDQHMQKYESEMQWVTKIHQALQHNHFELYYQHYQSLTENTQGHHYEVLLRMRDQEQNIISPGDFLPAAERYNLTAQIDRWVIEHYFNWLENNPLHQDQLARVNINLSGHSLADKELKLFVLNAFEKHKVSYHKVCFEITESMAILKMEETLEFINTFKQLGCMFALDDFGSGFSSYNYLKNLPVDQVKIDGGFVKDILIDPIDMAMVNSINEVAKAMGMQTVAEFVESSEIMIELGKMGVDYAQGYGIAKPQSLLEFNPH
ncbi:EAL domain-containing protein [Paraglaciecola aestuariivivens]